MTEEEVEGYRKQIRAAYRKDEATCDSLDGSAAALKAEIGALKEKQSKFWWHGSTQPNNGDLLEVLVLLDKLAAVVERIEKQIQTGSAMDYRKRGRNSAV